MEDEVWESHSSCFRIPAKAASIHLFKTEVMNNLKFVNAQFIAISLTVLVGFTSCQKEEFSKNESTQAASFETLTHRDGDDEEQAIIMGNVQNELGEELPNHTVKLMTTGGEFTSEITDENGEFIIEAPLGEYYFEIVLPAGGSRIFQTFDLTADLTLEFSI